MIKHIGSQVYKGVVRVTLDMTLKERKELMSYTTRKPEDRVKEAVKVLTEELKNDTELFNTYRANLAMQFKDEYSRDKTKYKNKEAVHNIANKAAVNFLNLWISKGGGE